MTTDSIKELCERLDRCSVSVAKVTFNHREEDDGMRTRVQLLSHDDTPIEEWDGLAIPGADVLRALRARWASVEQGGAGFFHEFTVRVLRRRARVEARA